MDQPTDEQARQEYYRDARVNGEYGNIWTSVDECVFCNPARDQYNIFEENGILLTVNTFAYIDGHVMIIPRRHVKSVKELTSDEWKTVRKCMYIAKKLIRKVHAFKDVQYLVRDGGLAVNSTVQDHLHMHCIPSDAPDLTVWNYRKLKNTPLENAALFTRQHKEIQRLAATFDTKYAELELPAAIMRNTKERYREAFKQMLMRKKTSQAKKTAKVAASIISFGSIISACNTNLSEGPIEYEQNDGTWVSSPTVAHAEAQCIAQAAKEGVPLAGATMIVSLSPCMACCRLIISTGIAEVHYIDDWWDQNALDFLKIKGIRVVKVPQKMKDV